MFFPGGGVLGAAERGSGSLVPVHVWAVGSRQRLNTHPHLPIHVPHVCCCSEKFRQSLWEFLEGKVKAYREVRTALGLPADARGSGPGAASLEYVSGVVGLTQQELEAFVRRCLEKYEAKRVDPGGYGGLIGG